MKHRTRVLVALFCVIAVVAGADQRPVDPFTVTDASFRERVDTIAIAPIRVTRDRGDNVALARRVEAVVAKRLSDMGYEVVNPDDHRRVWVPLSEQVGGVFDPLDGSIVEDRFDVVREHAWRELGRLHGADAVVWARIERGRLQLHESGYEWLAAGEAIDFPGSTSFGGRFLSFPHRIDGARLQLEIFDIRGVRLYAAGVDLFWEDVYRSRKVLRRNSDEPISDENIRRAVTAILDRRLGRDNEKVID